MGDVCGMYAARREKPRPSVTEPAAIGREARKGRITEFFLAESRAIEADSSTAASDERNAIRKLAIMPSIAVDMRPKPLPVISSHALSVNVPAFV